MYTSASETRNHTTLDYHPSLNDCHHESDGMDSNVTQYGDPQWSEGIHTNSLIFIVLVALCLLLMLAIFGPRCWVSQEELLLRISGIGPPPHDVQEETSKEIKTEEFITRRLILKHVVKYATGQQLKDEARPAELENLTQPSNFRKSDLSIPDGGSDDDEVDKENHSAACAICLCEYEVGDQICWSYNENCFHHFHSACGIAWLAKHSACPVCRSPYLVEPPKDDPQTVTETMQVEMDDANKTNRPSYSPDTSLNLVDHSEAQGDNRV